MEKISLFGLTFGHKRSCDSVMGGPIFANLVSKYARGFKEKTHEIARREVQRFGVHGEFCLGGGPPRPPPSAVRVKAIGPLVTCLCYVYTMFPPATAAPFQAAVVKTGCTVMGPEGTGYAKVIVVDVVQDLTSHHVKSRFDQGGLKRGCRGRREHSVNAA